MNPPKTGSLRSRPDSRSFVASNVNDVPISPAVFLDRDGTLMTDVEYCGDPARVAVFPGAADALARLRSRGYRLVMISNQSGIGRGYFSEDDFQRVQTEVFHQLGARGRLDGAYHCPERPEDATDRRKPGPGMIREAAAELQLDLARSWIVGDSRADVEAGRRAGLAGSVFVLTGKAPEERLQCEPDAVALDLAAAVDWILKKGLK